MIGGEKTLHNPNLEANDQSCAGYRRRRGKQCAPPGFEKQRRRKGSSPPTTYRGRDEPRITRNGRQQAGLRWRRASISRRGSAYRGEVNGEGVILVGAGGRVCAVSGECTRLGGPPESASSLAKRYAAPGIMHASCCRPARPSPHRQSRLSHPMSSKKVRDLSASPTHRTSASPLGRAEKFQ